MSKLGQSSASRRSPIPGLIRLPENLQSAWSSALRCHFSFSEFICFPLTVSQPLPHHPPGGNSFSLSSATLCAYERVRAVHFINVTFDGIN